MKKIKAEEYSKWNKNLYKEDKELTPLKALEELSDLANCGDLQFHERHNVWTRFEGVNKYKPIIETALKDYEKIEYKQNTINDFYPDTISMIKDLINLYETKVIDNLKSGELYTKDRLLEILGFASRYVLTFVKGKDFQGEH